jgi:hypothetical protein
VEHRPVAGAEVEVLLLEPRGNLDTGNVREAHTVDEKRGPGPMEYIGSTSAG